MRMYRPRLLLITIPLYSSVFQPSQVLFLSFFKSFPSFSQWPPARITPAAVSRQLYKAAEGEGVAFPQSSTGFLARLLNDTGGGCYVRGQAWLHACITAEFSLYLTFHPSRSLAPL
ncbi:hypothetical protein DFH11DRAFT_1600318 [Phellopilus nigrolimitatus]|nr:hypothetical protein DFH11DRAFT_1600318 [Phellopilus nigrolimitatus]